MNEDGVIELIKLQGMKDTNKSSIFLMSLCGMLLMEVAQVLLMTYQKLIMYSKSERRLM